MAWLVVFALSGPALAGPAAGDGGFFVHETAYDHWGLAEESTQFGLINYNDGYEKLMIAIKVPEADLRQSDRAVWLFPVPAPPEDVSIDLADRVSEFNGERLVTLAEKSFRDDILIVVSTQLYPVVVTVPAYMMPTFGTTGDGQYLLKEGGGNNTVEVFDSVMEYGVTTEVIAADSSSALYEYMLSLGLELPSEADPIIEDYLAREYSFVASWISNMTEFLSEAPLSSMYGGNERFYSFGVGIGFHSDRIFYPLKLTSVYGEAVVPMLVQVLGFVSPDSFPERAAVKADFLVDVNADFDSSMAEFFDAPYPGEHNSVVLEDVRYTEIVIDSKASTLTDDLWLDDSPTAAARTLDFVASNNWVLSIPLFVVASMLASLLAGMIVFKGRKPSGWKFAVLGLLNSSTLLGLWLGSRLLRVDERFVRDRSQPPAPHSVSSFVAMFTLLFLTLVVAIAGGFFAALA
ncbi:MAG: hypothetical protein A3K67_03945 [Euryarchaeota archaeon RBG_16_62_10]|nr:MAG: hypothetical protein A3K67_03945 [Euryarchaeota archaeon RBG_16_62_10]